MKTMKQGHYIYLVTLIGALGGILFGFDTGVISGALVFIQKRFAVSTLMQELIVSSVVLGAFFGALVSGRLADKLGRRCMLINAALAFIVGTLLSALAIDVVSLVLGRLIVGIAIGISSFTVPLFISEMSPAKIRGSLVMLNGIMITGGEAVSFLIDYGLTPSASWRWMLAVGLIPALLLFFGMLFLPETPRWLLLKGHKAKAHKVLEKIYVEDEAQTELDSIQDSIRVKQSSWAVLFSRKMRAALIIGLGLGILQQAFGINTVMYYGPTIFKAVGFKGESAAILATFGMGLVNTFMTVVAFFIVDKLGRRKLLLGGSAIAAISLLCVSTIFAHNFSSEFSKWFSVVALVFYIAGYCISVGSLFWLVISEIYPIHIRGLGMSFVTAVQWAANFAVAMSFLSILHWIGPSSTFCLYALMCLLCFVFCYQWVPETKGVSLEAIQENYEAGVRMRDIGVPVKPIPSWFDFVPKFLTTPIVTKNKQQS